MNVFLHHKQITDDIGKIKKDFPAELFKAAGQDIADLLVSVLGAIPKEQDLDTYVRDLTMTPEQVIDFVDGLILGLTGKEDLPEITKCLQHGDDIAVDITDAVEDFEKGDFPSIIEGIGEIGKVIEELPDDLGDCSSMQDDLKRIETWGKIFEDPAKLAETVGMNILKNGGAILSDGEKVGTDFDNGQFKASGQDIAEILVLTIGPIP